MATKLVVNGAIVVKLSSVVPVYETDDLFELANKLKLEEFGRYLSEEGLDKYSRRLVASVPFSRLDRLAEEIRTNPESRSNFKYYWKIDIRNRSESNVANLVKKLSVLPGIARAYFEPEATDPCSGSLNDSFANRQVHLDPAPDGLDACSAWQIPGGKGQYVRLVDLELGWLMGHEDLAAVLPATVVFGDNRDGVGTYEGNHGTAVLGLVRGAHNNLGIAGFAPKARIKMASHYQKSSDSTGHVAEAIVYMLDQKILRKGNILLLEVQRRPEGGGNFLPVEYFEAEWEAIRAATHRGVIVIEAAGNGGQNLDIVNGYKSMNRLDAGFSAGDSGALMVGVCSSAIHNDEFRKRWPDSNYGSRLDCFAPGGGDLVSCGYGDLQGPPASNSSYTKQFGNTSGAAAIIAGVAACVQGIFRKRNPGSLLSSLDMRQILSDPTTATLQDLGEVKRIGVMPDLMRIIRDKL